MTKIFNKTADVNFISGVKQTKRSEQGRLGKVEHKPVKDYIAPSNEKAKEKQEKGSLLKTTLPQPTTGFSGLSSGKNAYDNKQLGLIAIIAEVMISQAKCSSNFWSTLWNNASSEMRAQINLAPIIADATINAFNEQKTATMAQADEAEASGWINITAFAGGMLVGGVSGYKAADEEAGQASKKFVSNTDEEATVAPVDAAETDTQAAAAASDDNTIADATSQDADQAQADESTSARETAEGERRDAREIENRDGNDESSGSAYQKRASAAFDKGKDVMQKVPKYGGKTLGEAFTRALSIQQASGAVVSLTVTSPQRTIEANAQGKQGVFQAQEKELEQYAQFYGQSFSRSNELTQSAEQSFKNALDLMNGAVQQVTQTSISMLQG